MKRECGNLADVVRADVPHDTPAIIFIAESGQERIYTYGDVRQTTAGLAGGLLRRGLKRGERVAILSANRPEYLFSFLGVMRAGLVSVPVNQKLPSATVAEVLMDCDARLVLGDTTCLALAPNSIPQISFDPDDAAAFERLIDHASFAQPDVDPEDPAMFLYTSGSTGRPKGVVLSHRSQLSALGARVGGGAISPLIRTLVAAPLYHMNGLINCLVSLMRGDTIVLLQKFNAATYIKSAAQYRVNALTAVPTMIAMMLREHELLAVCDLSSVNFVRMASAPLTQSLIDQVRKVFPAATIVNGYGTTEGGPVVFGPHPDGLPLPEISVGYPLPQIEWRLVRDGREVGDEGALEIRSASTMTRYHNLPDLTARTITEDGYYRTKDIFKRDENGFFYFVGRADDMFVCGGENIYPGEIEALLERHPGIQQAAVVPINDELKGQKPIAFVVAAPGSVTEEDVKAYALANAPAYQHPRRVIFVDELPLAGTNKIDRRLLTERAHSLPRTETNATENRI